jgi:hypothetical protein
MVATDFFTRLTHRRTHLPQWRRWLRSKRWLPIADLPGIAPFECVIDATLAYNLHQIGVKAHMLDSFAAWELPQSTLFAYAATMFNTSGFMDGKWSAQRQRGAGALFSRVGLGRDVPTPAQKHLTNASSLREAATIGAMAIFKNNWHSLRGYLVQLLREDFVKQVEGMDEATDYGDVLKEWCELAKEGEFPLCTHNW